MTDRETPKMIMDLANRIEALAFEMKAPNAYTPQFVMLANEVRAIRARLAQPEPEPVAWGVLDDDGQIDWTADYPFSNEPGWPDSVPLYTAPPQRKWQGLTNKEYEAVRDSIPFCQEYLQFYYAIEKALKEKNGYD